MNGISIPERPWTAEAQAVVKMLATDLETGLSSEDVERRREEMGPNRLREAQSVSAWQILLEQFKSLIVLLLVVAAGLAFAFGEMIDTIAIAAVVVINALIGFITELQAVRSMEALQKLGDVYAKVRRDGSIQETDAHNLVPGDLVILQSGDVITADLRLLEAAKLRVDESALTGESVPVDKHIEPVPKETPLADRTSMVYKGTAVTGGSGEGIVVTTGMETELGEIASLVQEAEESQTPLEDRLDSLGKKLIIITLVIAAVVAVIGILQGREILQMIETAIALAVAAIPEGLPIVATIALARGLQKMARHNVLINRLAAVETLGGTNIICTDKTGTLTENQMTVTEIALANGNIEISGEGLERTGTFKRNGEAIEPAHDKLLQKALEVGTLCNNASLAEGDTKEGAVGDPVEVALLVASSKAGIRRDELLERTFEVREVAFDPDIKMMATIHKGESVYRITVKGAPEAVLERCSQCLMSDGREPMRKKVRDKWLSRNKEMAHDGLRVLAMAEKSSEDAQVNPYESLTFLGLVGLIDPPREDVSAAIEACQDAGLRVVMVTGDQAATASEVAEAVGLIHRNDVPVINGRELQDLSSDKALRERIREAPILARVNPKQKLDLIGLYQEEGLTVAMTGDGVNDAPALKKADIGVAMGQRGTQVAREAADMVLQDDAFSSIVTAVKQGRAIFTNIRKFVLYLLSCNLSEILTVGLASLLALPLPILPLQILYLNLVTDVFPALALGVGEAKEGIMTRPPRDPDEAVMLRHHWYAIGGYALLITMSVLGALGLALYWLEMNRAEAVTISFLTLAFAQLWHVLNMRDIGTNVVRNEITSNPYIWGALILCTLLLAATIYLPVLSDILKTTDPGLAGWLVVLGMSLLPLLVGQVFKEFGVGKV